MSRRIIYKLTVDGLSRRKAIYFPYLLSVVVMMALEYTMLSLVQNEFVQTRHQTLPIVINVGVVITLLLATIFIIYANQFIIKQRRQEFALYRVLGLESRHIHRMIALEQVVIVTIGSVLSSGLGFLIGHLSFMFLNKLMRDTGISFMDYPFSMTTALLIGLFYVCISLLLFVRNVWYMSRIQPAELLAKQNSGEGEPKSHWILLILGSVTLVAGYYIALTTQGTLAAIYNLVVAIFLVMIATFSLMVSLSVIVLKQLKKRHHYYYKPNHFLSVSGLIYRMKANGVSLAGISVLLCGIVMSLATTAVIYTGIENQASNLLQRDYHFTRKDSEWLKNENRPDHIQEDYTHFIQSVSQIATVKDDVLNAAYFAPAAIFTKSLEAATKENLSPQNVVYLDFYNEGTFNQLYGKNLNLKANQVGIVLRENNFDALNHLTVANEDYELVHLEDAVLSSRYVVNSGVLVVKNQQTMEKMLNFYVQYSLSSQKYYPGELQYAIDFNVEGDSMSTDQLEAILSENPNFYAYESITDAKKLVYSMNGGFLFIGIIIGIVLIIGMILMMYFKQLSEGIEDRFKYHIMKKVGLPQSLIKQTIRQQIMWLFALPLIVSTIHVFVASKIIFNFVGLFGVYEIAVFVKWYGIMIVGMILVYYILYLITSRIYYQTVNYQD